MSKKNVIVVPARGGSEEIKQKNLQKVGSEPLVVRSLRHAFEMGQDFSVVCSTDDQEILNTVTDHFALDRLNLADLKSDILHDLGKLKVHYRSPEYADSKAIIGTALQNLRMIYLNAAMQVDCWILLQPTSPFRSKVELRILAADIRRNFGPNDSWVSVVQIRDSHPARMYELLGESNKLSSLPGYEHLKAARRQDLPPVYLRDGAFYCISDALVSVGKQFSETPTALFRKGPWTINIDDEMDLELARIYAGILSE